MSLSVAKRVNSLVHHAVGNGFAPVIGGISEISSRTDKSLAQMMFGSTASQYAIT